MRELQGAEGGASDYLQGGDLGTRGVSHGDGEGRAPRAEEQGRERRPVGLEQALGMHLCLHYTKEVGEVEGKKWGLSPHFTRNPSFLEQKLPPPLPATQTFRHHPHSLTCSHFSPLTCGSFCPARPSTPPFRPWKTPPQPMRSRSKFPSSEKLSQTPACRPR